MRDYLDGAPPEGRLLVESGESVAGSMARSAAAVLFDLGSSGMRLPEDLARCLRDAATAMSALPESPASPRERYRAGAAIAFAVELVVTRAAEGRTARTDAFLVREGRDRAPADELAEAVLLAARRTTEEWRVRHLGYLLAEAAISEIGRASCRERV